MIKVKLLAEYVRLFPELNESLIELSASIPKWVFLKAATTFLNSNYDNIHFNTVLILWFRNQESKFVADIKRRHNDYYGDKTETVVFSQVANLKLLQFGLSVVSNHTSSVLDNDEAEFNLFKIYLKINDSIIELRNQTSISEKDYKRIELSIFMIKTAFSASEFSNYSFHDEFYCQTVKSTFLISFLQLHDKLSEHIKAFCKKYDINLLREYYERIFPLMTALSDKESDGFIEFNIAEDKDSVTNKRFIKQLCIEEYSQGDDLDFKKVRAKPLVEIDSDIYRITHPLFLTDKLYKSWYFELSAINETLAEAKISDFRSFYTSHFSEKYLLFKVIEYCFGSRYIKFSGEHFNKLNIQGAPDYYIRNGKYIFLIENKDVLINADIKENLTFEKLEKEFKKKFVEYKNKGVGIKQIISNIERILTYRNNFDNNFKSKNVIIYPILVIHDIMYDCPGVNDLLNFWFQEELKILKEKNLNVNKVKPLILLNIDTLIQSAELLKIKKIQLIDMLEVYLNHTKRKKKKYKSYEMMERKITGQILSASNIIRRYLNQVNPNNTIKNRIFEHANNLILHDKFPEKK